MRYFLGLLLFWQSSVYGYDAVVRVGKRYLLTELAITPEQREKGYMKRFYIPSFAAMLFVFPEENVLHFWMKNTYSPLEIRFYDAQKRLLQRYPQAMPCYADPCRIYSSYDLAAWVLETRPNILPRTLSFEILTPLPQP